MSTTHTLSVLVEDRPGVLARISALFSRRGFNIESLAVGPTELKGISRMTIMVSVEDFPLEQVTKQLNKLINVIKIVEQDPASSVAPSSHSSGSAGSASLVQWLYLPLSGGFTTPAICPEAASTKRIGPAKWRVIAQTLSAGAIWSSRPAWT